MKIYSKLIVLLCLGLAVGCTEAVDGGAEEQPGAADFAETAALGLSVDVLADTDVGGVQFTVTEVDCVTGQPVVPAHVETANVDLADMFIPGGNGTFEDAPYDANSTHLFADHYFNLAPGCYDVLVVPLTADGEPSQDCWSAHRDAVPVFAGTTTEILLIMQCRGQDSGGLDVIASVNHPPQITDLVFDPSKFTCEERTQVCVTIRDPDNDPVEVEWHITPSAQVVGQHIETNADGEIVACATISAPQAGSYDAAVVVFDMGYDAQGNLVRIEDLLAAQGDPHPSRAVLRFPIHRLDDEACINSCECPKGFELNEAGDACERTELTSVIEHGERLRVCPGNRHTTYSAAGAHYPGGLTVQNAFFGQSWSNPNEGRLNKVGVWACRGDSNASGSLPIGQWIGFATCVDLPQDADYLIGLGADNRVRFSVDGVLLSPPALYSTPSTSNFTDWWMIPVSLSAGAHTIQLEGLNDGAVAAFGAEIYGPFPAGSLSNDAAMAAADVQNNIIFSTADMVGGTFLSGENSGVSCPDGFSLDLCATKLGCSRTLVSECIDPDAPGNGGSTPGEPGENPSL